MSGVTPSALGSRSMRNFSSSTKKKSSSLACTEYKRELSQDLTALGMPAPFGDDAYFSAMSPLGDQLFISFRNRPRQNRRHPGSRTCAAPVAV